jgi:3-oxoacyl-[acyl-carrier-protein] synthase III
MATETWSRWKFSESHSQISFLRPAQLRERVGIQLAWLKRWQTNKQRFLAEDASGVLKLCFSV